MIVKPAIPGAVIRDPQTRQPLPAEGGRVPDDSKFWVRRLLAGEVVLVKEVAPDLLAPVAPLQTRGGKP